MTDQQLDLFSRREPAGPAIILAFPVARIAGRVRDCADQIMAQKTDRGRQRAHTRVLDGMHRQFTRLGMDEGHIRLQLEAFTDAVNVELWRREKLASPDRREG